ncbi:hypothetical protein D4Z78_00775 [Okeania hirsuta]|nr:hypothetical protein D4Z78_00775 [Okeania hirsuta]
MGKNLPFYSAFQIDEPHLHKQNFVGTFHGKFLLWSTQMKTAVNFITVYFLTNSFFVIPEQYYRIVTIININQLLYIDKLTFL